MTNPPFIVASAPDSLCGRGGRRRSEPLRLDENPEQPVQLRVGVELDLDLAALPALRDPDLRLERPRQPIRRGRHVRIGVPRTFPASPPAADGGPLAGAADDRGHPPLGLTHRQERPADLLAHRTWYLRVRTPPAP